MYLFAICHNDSNSTENEIILLQTKPVKVSAFENNSPRFIGIVEKQCEMAYAA